MPRMEEEVFYLIWLNVLFGDASWNKSAMLLGIYRDFLKMPLKISMHKLLYDLSEKLDRLVVFYSKKCN